MDQQTMRDYIEDLMEERAKLYEQIHTLKALIASLCDGIEQAKQQETTDV